MSDNKDTVRQQYGAHAAAYVTSAVHAKGASLARVRPPCGPMTAGRGPHAVFCTAAPFFCTAFMRGLLSWGRVEQPRRPPSAP